MKQTRKSAVMVIGLIMLFVLVKAGMAQAYSFSDMIDEWTVNVPILGDIQVGARPITTFYPLTYTHDIRDSVNFGAGDHVTSATLQLDFTNDIPCLEMLFPSLFAESVRVAYDGSVWHNIGNVDNGQYEIILNTSFLNDNGLLVVTIEVTEGCLGTAWLDHSLLYGTAEHASVPEPETLMLLGIGMLGIGFIAWRKFSR